MPIGAEHCSAQNKLFQAVFEAAAPVVTGLCVIGA